MDIIKQFNLPDYIKGKSFSEASKLIMGKFKDRNDATSKSTMAEMLGRLKEAQEYIKSNEIKQDKPYPGDDAINEMVMNHEGKAYGGNKYFLGGLFGGGGKAATGATGAVGVEGAAGTAGGGLSAVTGAIGAVQNGIGLFNSIKGLVEGRDDTLKEDRYNTHLQRNSAMNDYAEGGKIGDPNKPSNKPSKLVSLPEHSDPNRELELKLSYANRKKLSNKQLSGFEDQKLSDEKWRNERDKYYNNEFSKWRSGKTGNSPNSKFSQSSKEYKKAWKDIKNSWHKNNARKINDVVKDYASNDYAKGGRPTLQSVNELDPIFGELLRKPSYSTPGIDSGNESTIGNKISNIAGDALRYAPVLANAGQLLGMKKPEKEQLAKLDSRYKRQNVDERTLMKNINESFNENFLTESSGGSSSRYAANAQAAQLNKTKAISDAYVKADEINRGENRTKQQFDLGVDKFNTQVMHRESENFARDKGAYETEKSKLIGALGENLGGIGTEMNRDEMIKQLFDYSRKGRFLNENSKGGSLDNIFDYISKSYMKKIKK